MYLMMIIVVHVLENLSSAIFFSKNKFPYNVHLVQSMPKEAFQVRQRTCILFSNP